MKPIVYLESSVISYLTARPSRDVVIAGRQAITLDWWENHRQRFALADEGLVQFKTGRSARHPDIQQEAAAHPAVAGHQELRCGCVNEHLVAGRAQQPGKRGAQCHVIIHQMDGGRFIVRRR